VADACTLGIALVIVHYGWKLTAAATQTTATLKVPQYVVYAVVPVSAALIFVHTLRDFVGNLRMAVRQKD
jgi:TRAP-type C4-dicarboxylate transport system permease small subunit